MNKSLVTYLYKELNIEFLSPLTLMQEISIPFQSIILFGLFIFLQKKCFLDSTIPKETYQSNFILAKAFFKVKSIKFFIFLFFVLLIIAPFITWSNIDSNNILKTYTCILSFTIGFTFSTYSYNFYFNKSHLVDRIILILVSLLVYYHPIFILPTIFMSFLLIGQFFIPIYNSWTDKKLIFELCIIIIPFLILNGIGINISIHAFFIVTISVIAYIYFITGKGKLQMNWHRFNKISNLIYATYHQNNWLISLNKNKIDSLVKIINKFNPLFTYGTLLIELSIILVLIDPVLTLSSFIALIIFHFFIFLLSGIFFWKNIIILSAICFLISFYSPYLLNDLFGLTPLILSLFFIYILLRINHKTPLLYWWDSPMSVKFTFEIVTEDGLIFEIDPSQMAPYDINFAQGRFYNFFTTKKVVGTFGLVNDKKDLDFLNNIKKNELEKFISKRLKVDVIDDAKFHSFISFLKKYCLHINSGKKYKVLEIIKAPNHIWSNPKGANYKADKKIEKLNIYISERLKQKELFNKKIYTIEINNCD